MGPSTGCIDMKKAYFGFTVMVTAIAVLAGASAQAAAPGSYSDWTVTGPGGAWTGVVSPAAGYPIGKLTSNASTITSPTGASTYLSPATPPGAAYGSSQGRGYVNVSTAPGFGPSTTTLTFGTPSPAGNWAFVLGDIDADQIRVTATGPSGPVPTTGLGFAGVFNYCGAPPRPGTCTGAGPFTDLPTWDGRSSTLTGSGPDTAGASGWFQPTAALSTLTFTFTRQAGSPIFQLWIVSVTAGAALPLTGRGFLGYLGSGMGLMVLGLTLVTTTIRVRRRVLATG
jgi:hypothetical protein